MKKVTLLLICTLFTLFSCSKSEDSIVGKWGDNIKLSQKEVEFTSNSNFITITAEGNWWCIEGVFLNGVLFQNTNNLDLCSDNFIIEEADYRIQIMSTSEMKIEMNENNSGSERILRIDLSAGDYFDRIIITQAAI